MIDDEKYFLRNIAGTSLKLKDVRTEEQKAYNEDAMGVILFGAVVGIPLTVIFLFYLAIEYALGLIGVEGFIANESHGEKFELAVGIIFSIIFAVVFVFIQSTFMHKYMYKILEWTLSLDISSGVKVNIVARTANIKNLKKYIDDNILGNGEGHTFSYVLNRKILHEKEIVVAIKTHRTSFGNFTQENKSAAQVVDFGSGLSWSINGDGTVTDRINNLTWIQAPWGMRIEDNRFIGDSIKLSWVDATQLFGRGGFADSEGGYLDADGFGKSKFVNGYKHGSVVVSHAGQVDWRLPTADEFKTIQFWSNAQYPKLDYEIRNKFKSLLFPYSSSGTHFWSATGKRSFSKYQDINVRQLEGVKKVFVIILRFIESKVISKNECNAWRFSFEGLIDEHSSFIYPVLFVRQN